MAGHGAGLEVVAVTLHLVEIRTQVAEDEGRVGAVVTRRRMVPSLVDVPHQDEAALYRSLSDRSSRRKRAGARIRTFSCALKSKRSLSPVTT